MAPYEFVEIRLVCKADYLDPQLKTKLHEIRDKLRQLLRTGRKRFALKKVQPWNSVKVTFDIPKEAADRLRLLAIEGNICLIDLGIISIDIPGQSNTIVINKPSTMNSSSKELPTSSSLHSSYLHDNTNENDSWLGYKMKINGVHYYPPQQIQPNISSSRLNSTSIENS